MSDSQSRAMSEHAPFCDPPAAPRRSLNIGIVAYECIPGLVFVRVPNERARYMLVERCVAEVDCEHCNAVAGEPCKRTYSTGVTYSVGTHAVRRGDGRRGRARPYTGQKPKLRIAAEDLIAAAMDPET